MIRRYAHIVILAGGILAGGTVAAAHAGTNPVAALAGTNSSTSVGLTSALTSQGTTGTTAIFPGTQFPSNGRGGPHGQFGRGLTVTAVSGNTIRATGRGGQTITVQVTANTTYSMAGASAALPDIQTGSMIAVRSATTNGSSTSTTIVATSVTILLPVQGGVVTGVSGTTLTVTGFDGTTHTIAVSASTRYQKAGQAATLADIAAGTSIAAEGTRNADGSLAAVRVTIQVPRLHGQVTAVNGTSYTVSDREGSTSTVVTSGSTTYSNADGTAATVSSLKVGAAIDAEGSLSSDGKTLTALRITVELAGAGTGRGPGGPGHGDGPGYGDSDGPSNNGPSGTAPTAATPTATATATI